MQSVASSDHVDESPTIGAQLLEAIDEIGPDGLPRGKDCPVCGLPLEPGHTDESLSLTWFCPTHGPVEVMKDPLSESD